MKVVLELADDFDFASLPDDGVLQLCAADSLATALAGFELDPFDAGESAAVLLRRRRHRAPAGAVPFRRLIAGVAADADGDWRDDDLADLAERDAEVLAWAPERAVS